METVELQIDDSIRFEADETRLQQMFENVIHNAIGHGSDSLSTIRVGSLGSEGFYIEGDRVGIPGSIRDELFEWGTTTLSTETGLGLAVVSEIVTAHVWGINVFQLFRVVSDLKAPILISQTLLNRSFRSITRLK